MKSQTSIIANQVRLKEWADLIRECQSRPAGMTVDEWCHQEGITKANYYWRLKRVRHATPDRRLRNVIFSCAPDLKHQKQLSFKFSVDKKVEEELANRKVKKQIVCHPHFKLICDDSDLRVYFQWKDSDVGEDKKVLIGRIGRHPW